MQPPDRDILDLKLTGLDALLGEVVEEFEYLGIVGVQDVVQRMESLRKELRRLAASHEDRRPVRKV